MLHTKQPHFQTPRRTELRTLPEGFEIGDRELAAVFDEPIIYISQYAQAVRSVTAGYLLSYLADVTRSGQWWAMSALTVQEAIGISKNQFLDARELLMDRKVLLNQRVGNNPVQSLYQLNDDVLDELMTKYAATQTADMVCPPLNIARLHARTLAWRRLTVKSTLLLAALQERAQFAPPAETTAESNWFDASQQFIELRTALKRAEQDTARQRLQREKFIEMRRYGFPAVSQYRISYARLGVLTAHYLSSKS